MDTIPLMGNKMKILATILTISFVLAVVFFVYALDDWVGILAYKYRYTGVTILIAASVGLAWRVVSKKTAFIAALSVFALLMAPFVTETPSSRILREVMIKVRPGTAGSKVEAIVEQAYHNSGYAMPMITKRSDRIDVSLLTQGDGDCTAALFHIQDGVVVSSTFSPD